MTYMISSYDVMIIWYYMGMSQKPIADSYGKTNDTPFCSSTVVVNLIFRNFWWLLPWPAKILTTSLKTNENQSPALKPEQSGILKSAWNIHMPATRGRLQQAFDQSPALKPESSVKTRTKRYPKISVKNMIYLYFPTFCLPQWWLTLFFVHFATSWLNSSW